MDVDEWELRIADIRSRIEKLRHEIGYYDKSSHSQPQKSVEIPQKMPQKSARDTEMAALKAKLTGKK